MKKTILLLVISFIFALGEAYAESKILKFSIFGYEDSNQAIAALSFKRYVEEKSNGKYEVQLYFNNQFEDATMAISDVSKGVLDGICATTASFIPFVKQFGLVTLPYVFDSMEDVIRATTGRSHEFLNSHAIREGGFTVLCWTYGDFLCITNSVRPIKTMKDISGLKIRVPQSSAVIAFYKTLGAETVSIPLINNTFIALKEGTVDGQCNGYNTIKKMQIAEANQRYLTETKSFYQLYPLVISQKTIKKMSLEDYGLMIAAGKYAQEESLKYQISESGKIKNALIQLGISFDRLDDEQFWNQTAKTKLWNDMLESFGGKDALNTYFSAFGKQEWK